MLNSRPFLKNIVLIVLVGWPTASILDLLLHELLPFSFRLYGPDGEMWEGALYFSVICSLWLQAEESSLVEKKSLAEISFLRVVAGLIAGLIVGALLALPIWIITDHQQLLRMLDYVGFFEVGALGAVALWVLIYQKLFRRFYPAHYFRDDRLANLPNQEPNDPDDTDDTSPDPTNGDGGVIVEIPEAGQFSEAPLQENLQHFEAELEELSFRDLMERINRQTSNVNTLIYYSGQTKTIERNRKRLFEAISRTGNTNYSQILERAQAISETVISTKDIALSFVSFPLLASELHHDFGLYTRKIQLLINKLIRFISAYSDFNDSLRETISSNQQDLNRWEAEIENNWTQVQQNELTGEERIERLLEFNGQRAVLGSISDKLRSLKNRGMSTATECLQRANEDQRRLAAVIQPYSAFLRHLQSHITIPINVDETEEAVQNLDHAINALDAAIVAFNEALATADSFLIEQKLDLLASELSEPFQFPEFDEVVAFLESLMPDEPAGDFLRYSYILETPNELDVFLGGDFVEREFTAPLNLNSDSPVERLEEINSAMERLENHERQMRHAVGQIHL